MIYLVALVDRGVVRHKWLYEEDRFTDACKQLESLLQAFSEVDEVRPVLIKCYRQELKIPIKDILAYYVLS